MVIFLYISSKHHRCLECLTSIDNGEFYTTEKQMASSKEFLEYILEQLSEVEGITYRAMMGEYIIYCKDRIAGGIYDDRLLIKPVKSAIDYVSDIRYEVPYEGAKEMILIEEVDNKEYLTELFKAIYDDLPTPKKKK